MQSYSSLIFFLFKFILQKTMTREDKYNNNNTFNFTIGWKFLTLWIRYLDKIRKNSKDETMNNQPETQIII